MKKQEISKFISLILRHKPEVIGITLDKHGWANTQELIDGINKKTPFNISMLEDIVKTDNKQRYTFNEDKTKIRANQGHSVNVDVELQEIIPKKNLYHGTGERFVDSILKTGLKPMSRQYVHLSSDIKTATNVGTRHGKPVIFEINVQQMLEDGFTFFISKNGVYLTKEVPKQYLKIL